MKKVLLLTIALAASLTLNAQNSMKTFYDFSFNDINGKPFDMNLVKGKKILVVNTASECGLTPQYADLQKLYDKYKDKNFVILGFPANNFMGQEPGTNEQIAGFCSKNYGVTFPMMSKISVKGKDMHPLYKWLTDKQENGKENAEVKWNFQKFMINEKGEWQGVVGPQKSPTSSEIIEWIEK